MKAHSPGIVEFIEVIEDSDYYYLVSSLMNCMDLKYHLRERSSVNFLCEHELFMPLIQIVNALEQVHEAGFIHNDIQLSNIYLHRHSSGSTSTSSTSSHKASQLSTKLGGFSRCLTQAQVLDVRNGAVSLAPGESARQNSSPPELLQTNQNQ